MALTYPQCSEIVRGRLNLPTTAKLRIQKAVSNALQIFSERIVSDKNKRYLLTTPRSVAATPVLGVIDLAATVSTHKIMIDRLHQGRLYNVNRTFLPAAVSTSDPYTITVPDNGLSNYQTVRFTTTGTLPDPLELDTDYQISIVDEDAGSFRVYQVAGDVEIFIDFTTQGTGTHSVIASFVANEQPLQELSNPDFTAFPLNFADGADDKFWWLVGTTLYVYRGDGNPITTSIQFSVPYTASLTSFATSPIQELQDEFIDVLTELVAKAEAPREDVTK